MNYSLQRENLRLKKKEYKNCKTLSSVVESINTVVIFGASTTSVNFSVIGVGLDVLPISAEVALHYHIR